MIYELSTQCSGGMEARPLTELYELIPEELRKKILNACGPGTSLNCLLEYIVQYGEQIKKKEAIDFAEWIDGEGYECYLHDDEGIKHWHDIREKGNYTTPDLYLQHIQSKEPK